MINLIKNSIKDFHIFFDKLTSEVNPPQLLETAGFVKFRYPDEDRKTLCLIKTGRIISSLNAIIVLYEAGYFVEIAVLIRTIKEADAELVFIMENYPNGSLSKSQLQYIKEFFIEEIADPSNPIKSARKHNRVPSKKIHAGSARDFSELSKFIDNPKLRSKIQQLANPSNFQEISQKILNMWSGYVHYGYSQSMDLVGGSPPRFRLEGSRGTPRVQEWLDYLITESVAIYNLFVLLCAKFNFQKEFDELSNKQIEFQRTTNYD